MFYNLTDLLKEVEVSEYFFRRWWDQGKLPSDVKIHLIWNGRFRVLTSQKDVQKLRGALLRLKTARTKKRE